MCHRRSIVIPRTRPNYRRRQRFQYQPAGSGGLPQPLRPAAVDAHPSDQQHHRKWTGPRFDGRRNRSGPRYASFQRRRSQRHRPLSSYPAAGLRRRCRRCGSLRPLHHQQQSGPGCEQEFRPMRGVSRRHWESAGERFVGTGLGAGHQRHGLRRRYRLRGVRPVQLQLSRLFDFRPSRKRRRFDSLQRSRRRHGLQR